MGTTPDEMAAAEANQSHALAVATRVMRNREELRSQRGELQGHILRDVNWAEIAAILEGFRYTFHNPDPTKGVGWNLKEYYRPPAEGMAVTAARLPPRSDPFLIAAYLRYWRAAFEQCDRDPSKNNYRGLDGVSRWQPCPPPSFNLAVRRGSLLPVTGSPFEFGLLHRAVDLTGVVGSR
jgi:hypothetical protein